MNDEASPKLSPFAFPSETDARFLLLVVAIIGATLILADGFIGSVLIRWSNLLSFIAAIGITVSVFWAARQSAQQYARRRIQAQQLKAFPPDHADPLKADSLGRMNRYIQQVVERLPLVSANPPEFVWDEVSEGSDRPSGTAFGYGRKKYVCLRNGLHEAFIQAPQSNRFNAVLMHELGHIENQDVDKTIFSITLGRSFFRTALVLLALFDIYLVWSTLDRMMAGDSLQPIREGIPTILSINVKSILLILLVEISRSSVLRVREYYADARARVWLGQSTPFLELFQTGSASKETVKPAQKPETSLTLIVIWRQLRAWFYRQLAPVHPSHKRRIEVLLNPLELYRPSREVAFLAGLLSGLSLNASFLMSPGLTELWDLAGVGIIILYLALILACLMGLGVLPIAGAVGLQVQAAAYVSHGEAPSKHYTTLGRLALLSLLMGLGFVMGCRLTPMPSTFSLLGVPLTILPWFVLFWAITFWLWLLPLKWLAKALYSGHTGGQNPRRKRRFLTAVSIVALLPSFVTTSMAHVSLSVRMAFPNTVDVPGLEWVLFGLTLLGLCLQAAVWAMGWRWMNHCGWFRPPQCSSCHTRVSEVVRVNSICPTCQNPLLSWACMEPSISLPSLPPPIVSSQGPPPLGH